MVIPLQHRQSPTRRSSRLGWRTLQKKTLPSPRRLLTAHTKPTQALVLLVLARSRSRLSTSSIRVLVVRLRPMSLPKMLPLIVPTISRRMSKLDRSFPAISVSISTRMLPMLSSALLRLLAALSSRRRTRLLLMLPVLVPLVVHVRVWQKV